MVGNFSKIRISMPSALNPSRWFSLSNQRLNSKLLTKKLANGEKVL